MRRSVLIWGVPLLACALLAGVPATALAAGRFAFIRNLDLYLMNADGTGQTRVAHTKADESCPAWARNGKTLAFARVTRQAGDVYRSSVWLASPAGKNVRRLIFREPMAGYRSTSIDSLCWSPNGASIAVTDRASKGNSPVSRVLVVNRRARTARVIYKIPGDFSDGMSVSWNRDGKRLLVNVLPTDVGNGSLLVINAATKRRVTLPGGGGWAASYSPDGTKIGCVQVNAVGAGVTYHLVVMNANGTGARRLFTTSTGQNAGFYDSPPVSWSGDGKKIAYFLSTMSAPPLLTTWTIDVATQVATKIADRAEQPAWQR